MEKDKTYENSLEAAKPIKKIMDAALELDLDYLKSALKDMRENHHSRDAMMILNPSPFTHSAKQDLNAAKIKQLELMIGLGENCLTIMEKEVALRKASNQADDLSKMFGL